MADDTPSLSTYEEMADVQFDLSDEDLSRDVINQEIEDLFSS